MTALQEVWARLKHADDTLRSAQIPVNDGNTKRLRESA